MVGEKRATGLPIQSHDRTTLAMNPTPIREARLRPEAAARFPGIPVGTWLPAGRVATECLRAGASSLSRHTGLQRLPEDAFDFRGGRWEMPIHPRARTRWADHPGPGAGPSRARRAPASQT